MDVVQRLVTALFPARPRSRPQSYRATFETLESRCTPAVTVPSELQLTPLSATEAKLQWVDSAGETGYRILRWDGAQIQTVATLDADSTSYTATGLTPLQKQYFAVEAFDDETQAFTPWASATMPAEALSNPAYFQTHATSSSTVQIHWGDAAGATGFRIFQWDGTQATKIADLDATASSYTVTGLAANEFHYFYLEAYNNSNSAVTAWSAVRTLPESITAPTSLNAIPRSPKQIDLVWSDVSNETGYRVYSWNGASAVQIAQLGPNVTTYSVTNLAPGKPYWFYVEAFNATNSAATPWKQANTPTAPKLAAPTATVQVISRTSALLKWNSVAGASGYNIYQSVGGVWTKTRSVNGQTLSLKLDGLVKGRRYYFVVQAFSSYGEYANSKLVTFIF